ncbi:hypothetical protein AAG906_021243 [Vitis piasezkii]
MNFMSYEHLVEKCPTIPAMREMFTTQQASNLEQAMVNLSKVVGDFVGAQKSINAHLGQRIDVESSLNKRMDEVQNDLSRKIDNLQDSISRFANLNTFWMIIVGGNAKMMKEKEEKREFWPLVLFPLSGHILSTFSSPFYTYYIPFRSSGSQESNASNGVQIGVETKKLWSLQENCTELSGNFAHLNPRCENFRTTWPPSYEMTSKLQNDMQKHFAKPREIAKMPTEPHNHASKEESPLTEITHEASHSISDLLKPSKPIAPAESSS